MLKLCSSKGELRGRGALQIICEKALLKEAQVIFEPVLLSTKSAFKNSSLFLMHVMREATGV